MEAERKVPLSGIVEVSQSIQDEVTLPINGDIVSSSSCSLLTSQSQCGLEMDTNTDTFDEVHRRSRRQSQPILEGIEEIVVETGISQIKDIQSQTGTESSLNACESLSISRGECVPCSKRCKCASEEIIVQPECPKATCIVCIQRLVGPLGEVDVMEVMQPTVGPSNLENITQLGDFVIDSIGAVEDAKSSSGRCCANFDKGYMTSLAGICEILGFIFFLVAMILDVMPFQGGPYFGFILFASLFGWFACLVIFCSKLFLTAHRLNVCYRAYVSRF